MALATYTELLAAVDDWLDLGGTQDARIADFIRLTESRLNRLLEDPDMEVAIDTVASSTYTALPDDFGSMVSVSTGQGPLSAMSAADYAGLDVQSGNPRYYTLVDGSITFAPANSSATISLVYRRTIPALSDTNTTNWLLTRAPDAYLYGSLVQASGFLAEDDRIGMWKAAFDEAIDELRSDAAKRKWGAGPIAPRIRRT